MAEIAGDKGSAEWTSSPDSLDLLNQAHGQALKFGLSAGLENQLIVVVDAERSVDEVFDGVREALDRVLRERDDAGTA